MADKRKKNKGFSKDDRLVGILLELFAGKCLKKAEIANRYEVSEKTIQRDIGKIKEGMANLAVRESIFYSLDYDTKKKGYGLKGMVIVKREEEELFSAKEMEAVCKAVLDSNDLSKEEKHKILPKILCGCVPEDREKIWKWILDKLL